MYNRNVNNEIKKDIRTFCLVRNNFIQKAEDDIAAKYVYWNTFFLVLTSIYATVYIIIILLLI